MVREHVAWRVWVLIGAVGALAATAAVALLVGEFPAPWRGVAKALGEPGAAPQSVDFIIWEVRVPRLLAGAASGAAFGVAAALLQTAWGTPLAGPRTAGMGGAAMLAIVLAPGLPGGAQGPLGSATAGAIGAAAAGLGLGLALRWRWGSAGTLRPGTVLLAGTALDVLCTAVALSVAVSAVGGVGGPRADRLVAGSPLLGVEHAPVLSALCAAAALLGAGAAWRAPA
ncbi:iron chelate uptake ABC transporter family permease subunit, partial [Nocardiopsis gilva]